MHATLAQPVCGTNLSNSSKKCILALSGKLSEEEFNLLPINRLDAYLSYTQLKHPFHRSRYSEHAWLTEEKGKDPVLRNVYDRLVVKIICCS